MPTRFIKPRIPKDSRVDLAAWITDELKKLDRADAMRFLLSYFTTVDLDLIKADMIARKDLAQ
jgi:hypothetical protein